MKTKVFVTKVAGVTYEGRQDHIRQMKGNEPVRIVPEPENPHDPNALAVHVALKIGKVVHVGYIPRDLAAKVAPYLEGESVMARIIEVTGGFTTWGGNTASYGLRLEIEVPVEDAVYDGRDYADDYTPHGDFDGD